VSHSRSGVLLEALPQGLSTSVRSPRIFNVVLYDAFRLEIVHDHAHNTLRAAVTIFGEVVATLAETAAEVMVSAETQKGWCDVENSTAPAWSVPPAGDAPDRCRADLRTCGGQIQVVGLCSLLGQPR
jgi:hypothetical protein